MKVKSEVCVSMLDVWIRKLVVSIVPLRKLVKSVYSRWSRVFYKGPTEYWVERYKSGKSSGLGSYGKLAEFKADVINELIDELKVVDVVEFGCGDGNQLSLAKYPKYVGYDISEEAIKLCRKRFLGDSSKSFDLTDNYAGSRFDLALSLDVVYHLTSDDVFDAYMDRLFGSATKAILIYSSNTDQAIGAPYPHIKHRKFTDWVLANEPKWKLDRFIPNRYPYNENEAESSFADFYLYLHK